MNRTPLYEFVEINGQSESARLLNVSAPAIHKAIKKKRNITVTENTDGSFSAQEVRPFPSRSDGTL